MSPGAWQEAGSVANRRRGEEAGRGAGVENSLERQGSNRGDVKWLRGGENKGGERLEGERTDVQKEDQAAVRLKVEDWM